MRLHPLLLFSLLVLWGAGSVYFFATGAGELLQINHEMSEALTKGNTRVVADQAPLVRIHIGWRLVLGTVLLGLAMGLFRRHHGRQRWP